MILLITLVCWFIALQFYQSSNQILHGNRIYSDQPTNINSHHHISRNHSSYQKLSKLEEKVNPLIIKDNHDNLFHFMQISDIHISTHIKSYEERFDHFLKSILPLIQPEVVFVTGDLTDAKDKTKLTSLQYVQEWLTYMKKLKDNHILEREDFWFDMRGNHDCFNVPSFTSKLNFFKEMSVLKKPYFHYNLNKHFGTYSFIGFDGCPKYGTSRPFNFFSYIDSETMTQVVHDLDKVSMISNHTFMLSHYPTTTTVFGTAHDGRKFDGWVSKHITAYLCGHLHKLTMGLGETLYSFFNDEFLELELADMKQHTTFRIFAIDHDLVSFKDFSFSSGNSSLMQQNSVKSKNAALHFNKNGQIPIMITNPKNSVFALPAKEPLHRILGSTHIRFLAWNTSAVRNATIFVDGSPLKGKPQYKGFLHNSSDNQSRSPLWVLPWNPKSYDDKKFHTLRVELMDSEGLYGFDEIEFSFQIPLKNRKVGGVGEVVMKIGFAELFRDLFIGTYFSVMLMLLFVKLYVNRLQSKGLYKSFVKRHSSILVELDRQSIQRRTRRSRILIKFSLKQSLIDSKHTLYASFLRLCELARTNHVFFPLYIFGLYLSVGPLFIGCFISKAKPEEPNVGAFMLYGIRFFQSVDEHGDPVNRGEWIPLPDTWLQYLHELYYVYIPLISYLSFCTTDSNLLYDKNNSRIGNPFHLRWYIKLSVVACMIYQFIQCYLMSVFYGPIAFFASPGKLWICLWSFYCVIQIWSHHHDDNVEKNETKSRNLQSSFGRQDYIRVKSNLLEEEREDRDDGRHSDHGNRHQVRSGGFIHKVADKEGKVKYDGDDEDLKKKELDGRPKEIGNKNFSSPRKNEAKKQSVLETNKKKIR